MDIILEIEILNINYNNILKDNSLCIVNSQFMEKMEFKVGEIVQIYHVNDKK